MKAIAMTNGIKAPRAGARLLMWSMGLFAMLMVSACGDSGDTRADVSSKAKASKEAAQEGRGGQGLLRSQGGRRQQTPVWQPVAQTTAPPPVAAAGSVRRTGGPQPALLEPPRWSNPATWGGSVPPDGATVRIPAGKTILLDTATSRLKGLDIEGALIADHSRDVAITSDYVMVMGPGAMLQIGLPGSPHRRRATITLTGAASDVSVMGMGTKVLGAMNGGLLDLHGEQRMSWSQLAANADVGATAMRLKDSAATWRAGDRLVVVSSGFDPREAEVVTVTGVSNSTVTFTPALAHRHLGLMQTFEGKALDQRAAVGLLSRNVVVQGASDSDAQAFGGHIMIMEGGRAQVSGVELRKMGQRGRFGRYPIHWHKAGDRAGDFLAGSSIHSSFHRAAVIHSTHNVRIDGNVAYNIPSHAYVWAEDGDEYGNQLINNLGVLVRNPAPEHFAFPINNAFHGNTSQSEHRSGVFWGRSFDKHVIRGNISAGALDGFGFFFDLFAPAPFGDDEGGQLVFDGNIAHSTYKTFSTGNQINYPESTTGHGLMVTTGTSGRYTHVFRGYTGYHNVTPVWLEDRSTVLRDSIVADNGNGVTLLRGVLDGVVVVGKSGNPVPIQDSPASIAFGERAGVQIAASNHGGKRAPVIANVTIVNHDGPGIIYDVDNVSPEATVRNVKFVNTPDRFRLHPPLNFEFPYSPVFGLNDPNGAIAGDGVPVRWMTYSSNLVTSACRPFPNFEAYACPMTESFSLDSAVKLILADTSGPVSFAEFFDYADASMPGHGATSLVGHGRRYEVRNLEAHARHDITIRGASGKWVELVFVASASPTSASFEGQPIPQASSLVALRASASTAQFHDAAAQRLHLKLVGTSNAAQKAVLQGSFLPAPQPSAGVPAIALPSGATSGFTAAVHAANAQYGLRYSLPTGQPVRVTRASGAIVRDSTAAASVSAQTGDATVVRGYINAPVDGIYRFALWGAGGGTSFYVDDVWVMGQPWAFINSNFVVGSEFETEVRPYLHPNGLISLKAGWHRFSIVHAKFPQNQEGVTMDLRWATPQNPGLWVYPQVRREP